jgi:hypothetical protein
MVKLYLSTLDFIKWILQSMMTMEGIKMSNDRITGKRSEILFALKQAGSRGITNVDLSKFALRYGGYLGALYEQGYKIDKEHLGNGVFRYTLISEPKEHVEKPKAIDVLFEKIGGKFVTVEDLKTMFEDIGLSIRYKAGTHQQ